MKKILFFITAIIFIVGCGSSTSTSTLSGSELSPKQAIVSNILIFKNISSAKLAMTKKELAQDFKTSLQEFAYSPSVTCESLGFSENRSPDPAGSNAPTEKFYFISGSSADCLEIDHAKTSDTGTQGLVVVLPASGGPKDIAIN